MNKENKYKSFKDSLKKLNLSPAEYDKRIREWCKKNKY